MQNCGEGHRMRESRQRQSSPAVHSGTGAISIDLQWLADPIQAENVRDHQGALGGRAKDLIANFTQSARPDILV